MGAVGSTQHKLRCRTATNALYRTPSLSPARCRTHLLSAKALAFLFIRSFTLGGEFARACAPKATHVRSGLPGDQRPTVIGSPAPLVYKHSRPWPRPLTGSDALEDQGTRLRAPPILDFARESSRGALTCLPSSFTLLPQWYRTFLQPAINVSEFFFVFVYPDVFWVCILFCLSSLALALYGPICDPMRCIDDGCGS